MTMAILQRWPLTATWDTIVYPESDGKPLAESDLHREIEEYYLYDPTGDYLKPPLAAFQRAGAGFAPMQPHNGEMRLGDLTFLPGEGESPEYVSPRLRLRLALDEQNRLQFYSVASGQRLLSDFEISQQFEAENARLRAELARLRGELA